MLKKTIGFVLAASALLFLPSGATQVTARRENTQAQAVSIIPNPPDGWTSKVNISNLPGESSFRRRQRLRFSEPGHGLDVHLYRRESLRRSPLCLSAHVGHEPGRRERSELHSHG